MRHIDHKAAKLIRIDWDEKDGCIIDIRITGDFFIHPEEGISMVEDSLKGKQVMEAAKALQDAMDKNCLEIVGFKPGDIQDALLRSLSQG